MRILNYGAGALGLGLDSFLIKSGAKVSLIARPETVSALKHDGLLRTGIFGEFRASADRFACASSLMDVSSAPFDFILVSAKSFDSQAAATDLQRHNKLWNQETKIVLCQNGWGNAEIFCQYFPKEEIYNARVITGFERPQPNHVNITVHADAVHLGRLFSKDSSALTPLSQALTSGGMPTQIVSDIAKDLWAKMLYNCALNALGAIFDMPYGKLGESYFSRKIMQKIFVEIYEVMSAAGYQTHWPNTAEYEKAFYSKFLPPTAGHRSSTLQDMQAGKRTEIDALNGMIVHMAERLKVSAEVNRTVYTMVKFLEESNRRAPVV